MLDPGRNLFATPGAVCYSHSVYPLPSTCTGLKTTMDFHGKVLALFQGHGIAGPFAVRLLLEALLPFRPDYAAGFAEFLEYVRRADRDELTRKIEALPPGLEEYLQDIEAAFDILLGPLRPLLAQVAVLENMPAVARHLLELGLLEDDRCQAGAWRLYDRLVRREMQRQADALAVCVTDEAHGSMAAIFAGRMRWQGRVAGRSGEGGTPWN